MCDPTFGHHRDGTLRFSQHFCAEVAFIGLGILFADERALEIVFTRNGRDCVQSLDHIVQVLLIEKVSVYSKKEETFTIYKGGFRREFEREFGCEFARGFRVQIPSSIMVIVRG